MSAQTGRLEPQRWGRYELISQIATGPLGPLWVARAAAGPEAGRVVFVRRVARGAPVAGDTLEELEHAALVATDVRHPKLAAVLDTAPGDHELSIISEYLEGEVLRALLRRAAAKSHPLSTGVALRLGLDLAEAVMGARAAWDLALQATAARDDPALSRAVLGGLCADNVLVTSYGEGIILDVGLWGTARRHPALAHHPDAMSHAAPEQLTKASPVDERSDVFSIGVMVWEMLANRPLFAAPNWSRFSISPDDPTPVWQLPQSEALRRKVLEAPIARLDAVVRAGARVDGRAAGLVARALMRDPAERYASLEEMKQAFEGYGTLATQDEVAGVVRELAATSIEARRAALANLLGQSTVAPEERLDSARPTLPPNLAPIEASTANQPSTARAADGKKLRLPLPGRKPRVPPEPRDAISPGDREQSGTHEASHRSEPKPESSTKTRSGRKKPPLPPRRKRGGGNG